MEMFANAWGVGYLIIMISPLLAVSMPGWPEMIFIFIICLLLFGAKKLPALARGIGQSIGEFKKAREEFEHGVSNSASPVESKEAAEKQPQNPA